MDRRLLGRALSTSLECATLGQLEDLARAPTAVRDHVRACARCLGELELMRGFVLAAPRAEEKADVEWISARLARRFPPPRTESTPVQGDLSPRRWFPPRIGQPAGLALAAAMMALAVSVAFRESIPPALRVLSAEPRVFRSPDLAVLSPSGDLDAPPAQLRWEPVPAASSYAVQLTDVDREEIWSAETRDASAVLPPGVRRHAVPAKTLLWQVTARDAAGNTIAQSAVQKFRVRPSEQ